MSPTTEPWTTESITTDRLRLRCPNESDRALILRILTDAEVRKHLGGPVPQTFIESFDHFPIIEQVGLFVVILLDTLEPIGTVAIEHERGAPELSFQFIPERWGMGLACESCAALLAWLWRTTTHESVIAVTSRRNAPAVGLLRRLGFTHEADFEEDDEIQSRFRLERSE